MTDEHEWITPLETAKRMNISRMAVYRLIHSGKLAATKMTERSIRVKASSVDEHIKAGIIALDTKEAK